MKSHDAKPAQRSRLDVIYRSARRRLVRLHDGTVVEHVLRGSRWHRRQIVSQPKQWILEG